MNNKASDEWSVGNLRSKQIIVGSRKFLSIPRQRSVFYFELYRRRCFYSKFSLSLQLFIVFEAEVVLVFGEGTADGPLAADAGTTD